MPNSASFSSCIVSSTDLDAHPADGGDNNSLTRVCHSSIYGIGDKNATDQNDAANDSTSLTPTVRLLVFASFNLSLFK